MKLLKIFFIALLPCVFVAGSSMGGEGFSPTVFAAGFTFTRNLTIGIRGDDVSALQQFLIDGGFLKIPASTGYFGDLTKEGVRRFQEKNSIAPAAGYFGPITRAIMNQESASPIYQSVPAIPASPTVADLQKQIEALLMELQKLQISASTTISTSAQASFPDPVIIPPVVGAAVVTPVVNNGSGLPVRLIIPKMNVDAGFQYNGLTSDGTMEIPDNVIDIGWFTGSPRPGEIGSSVITGHTAQIRGGILTKQGVFSNLRELRPGDKLHVINDKGENIVFIVRESRIFDPNADASDVFSSGDGKAHLNLITCEGFWNKDQLSYSERLVVFTDLAQ